jgi:ankyrin repeat protein
METTSMNPEYEGTNIDGFECTATALMAATAFNDAYAVAICIKLRHDVDARNFYCMSAIDLAAMLGHIESANLLIAAGCHIQTEIEGDVKPPSFYADGNGHRAILASLAAALKNPIKRNRLEHYDSFSSPALCYCSLHACAFHGELPAVKALIESSYYDKKYKDRHGFDPFMTAAIGGNVSVARYLLSI